MIIGTYSSNISKQRRLAVPKKVRQTVGDNFIVTKWYEGCLVLVSQTNWNALLDKLTSTQKILVSPVRDTDRFIMGSAFEVKTDSQGRVVLPEKLADYAELKEEALFIGLGDRVEIWDKAKWEKQEEYLAKNASELIEKMGNNV